MKKKMFFLLLSVISLNGCEKKTANTPAETQFQMTFEKSNVPESVESESVAIEENTKELPILFSLDGLYGYLNSNLQVIIPPVYSRGFNYTEHGYAFVSYRTENGQREGRILDLKGNIVFSDNGGTINPLFYDDIISYTPYGERFPRIIRFRDNIVIENGSGVASPVNNDIIILVFDGSAERFFIDVSGKRILPNFKIN